MLVAFGEDLREMVQPTIVIEQSNIFPMPSFVTALECCLAAYYVFNIQYDSGSKALCLLLEFIYEIKFRGKLPLVVQGIIDSLS